VEIVEELRDCADRVVTLPPESEIGRDAQILSNALRASDADVFIPNYRVLPHAAAALCSRQISTRTIGICHNDHVSSYELLQRYESCLSRLVCASNATSKQLMSRIPWRAPDVVTIPHGVRVSRQPCVPFAGGELRLIYHGRLIEEQKRISLLVEIARKLSARQIPFHLTLVGDGPAALECRRAAQEGPLRGRLSIYASESWESLSQRLVSSHVAVLTSEYEGFCLSLAEGIGSGLPAVAFECGDVIEQFLIHESTGLLVKSGAIDDFVSAIAGLQTDAALWSRLSANARDLICRNFSWSSIVRKYVNLFEDVLRDPVKRRWPLLRPAWLGTSGRTMRSVIERIGKEAWVWR
jgi:glycosyltransferase involved in cell wall biosynthesis